MTNVSSNLLSVTNKNLEDPFRRMRSGPKISSTSFLIFLPSSSRVAKVGLGIVKSAHDTGNPKQLGYTSGRDSKTLNGQWIRFDGE